MNSPSPKKTGTLSPSRESKWLVIPLNTQMSPPSSCKKVIPYNHFPQHLGLAHVCLITPTMTIVRQRIESAIPRKRKGSTEMHEKGLNKFFEMIFQAIQRHINFAIVKCVLIASPGFVKVRKFFQALGNISQGSIQ